MGTKLKIISIFILLNILIYIILSNITIDLNQEKTICIIKNITGKECLNCGMTRAFLAMLQLDFDLALKCNKNVIIVFPMAIIIYLHSFYKYFFKNCGKQEYKK